MLDANVFIEAHKRYYAFDLCPGYWAALLSNHHGGQLCSIGRVRDELVGKGDALSDWVQGMPDSFFVETGDPSISALFGNVVTWVQAQPQYFAGAKAAFAAGADGWLVAYAKAQNLIVATDEIPNPDIKRRTYSQCLRRIWSRLPRHFQIASDARSKLRFDRWQTIARPRRRPGPCRLAADAARHRRPSRLSPAPPSGRGQRAGQRANLSRLEPIALDRRREPLFSSRPMPYWVAVRTALSHERLAWEGVGQRGFETFIPKIRIKVGAQWKTTPLFGTYFFVRVVDQWRVLERTMGVISVVKFGAAPAHCPDEEIAALLERADRDGIIRLSSRSPTAPRRVFAPGAAVAIADGPFRGFDAIHTGMTVRDREMLLIDLLGRRMTVGVPAGFVAMKGGTGHESGGTRSAARRPRGGALLAR